MRRFMLIILCLGLTASLVALSGCGKKETTVKTPEGEVTVEEGGEGKVTVRTEEGETTYETTGEAPSEEELGAPIYPEAEYVPGSGGTAKGTQEGQVYAYAGGTFKTGDDFEKVLAWYKGKLGEPMYESTSPKEASWIMGEEKDVVTVSISEEDGETTINIVRMSGTK